MTGKYALITICRDEVAPRFDMTAEALLTPLFPAEEAGRRNASTLSWPTLPARSCATSSPGPAFPWLSAAALRKTTTII